MSQTHSSLRYPLFYFRSCQVILIMMALTISAATLFLKEYAPLLGLIVGAQILAIVGFEYLINGFKARMQWAWTTAVVLTAIKLVSIVFPFAIYNLICLLKPEVRDSFKKAEVPPPNDADNNCPQCNQTQAF